MSSIRLMDMLKLSFRALQFRYEQGKLTTGINAIVKTAKGAVKGVKRLSAWEGEYYSFERIPYAKPPLGELRFKAPQPAEPWDDVLDGTGSAEIPLQSNVFFRKYKGSEDCLYLNVFTKDLTPTQLRPVMVWIYGGGFQIGEATRDMYSPDFFMSKDVVLVTIAYRLGAFGFLSMEDPSVDVPGNAGLKDQILSLRWVQENISAFGGDPNNVTLFGESAGGTSTHLCMLSKQSEGLISKAIVMSGSALCPWARPPKNNWAYRLAQGLGYKGDKDDVAVFQFLQNAHGPSVVKCAGSLLKSEEKHNRILFSFGPVVEPYLTEQCVLAEDPYELMKTSWSNRLPLLIGGTSFEGLLFYPEVYRRPATLNEVKNCKNLLPMDLDLSADSEQLAEFGLALKKSYFGEGECNRESMMQFLELLSYREFWHPIFRTVLSRLQYAKDAPTYLYRFDFDSKDGNVVRNIFCGGDVRGTCHGDDLCYLFRAVFSYNASKDSEEVRIQRAMIDIWYSFAATSDPNCKTLEGVQFEPLSKDADIKCLNIANSFEFIPLPELQKLQVWNSFYPQGKL